MPVSLTQGPERVAHAYGGSEVNLEDFWAKRLRESPAGLPMHSMPFREPSSPCQPAVTATQRRPSNCSHAMAVWIPLPVLTPLPGCAC